MTRESPKSAEEIASEPWHERLRYALKLLRIYRTVSDKNSCENMPDDEFLSRLKAHNGADMNTEILQDFALELITRLDNGQIQEATIAQYEGFLEHAVIKFYECQWHIYDENLDWLFETMLTAHLVTPEALADSESNAGNKITGEKIRTLGAKLRREGKIPNAAAPIEAEVVKGQIARAAAKTSAISATENTENEKGVQLAKKLVMATRIGSEVWESIPPSPHTADEIFQWLAQGTWSGGHFKTITLYLENGELNPADLLPYETRLQEEIETTFRNLLWHEQSIRPEQKIAIVAHIKRSGIIDHRPLVEGLKAQTPTHSIPEQVDELITEERKNELKHEVERMARTLKVEPYEVAPKRFFAKIAPPPKPTPNQKLINGLRAGTITRKQLAELSERYEGCREAINEKETIKPEMAARLTAEKLIAIAQSHLEVSIKEEAARVVLLNALTSTYELSNDGPGIKATYPDSIFNTAWTRPILIEKACHEVFKDLIPDENARKGEKGAPIVELLRNHVFPTLLKAIEKPTH